jgi:kynurenine formamidase
MQVIDLSQSIEPGMPCYSGASGPLFQPISSIEKDGFAEQRLTISSHTGTHIDLPSHIIEGAPSLETFDINRFAGKGVVLDVRDAPGNVITIEMLKPFFSEITTCEFLLLCSGMSRYWGTPLYFESYPVLSPDAAQWLSGFNLQGIGVDMISVDAPDKADFPVHKSLLQNGLVIIENLTGLLSLLHTPFLFCCFPLKIVQGEASPVRAVAIVNLIELA